MPNDVAPPNGPPPPLLSDLTDKSSRSAPAPFISALLLPFRAARFLLGQPRLWPLAALPACINVALFGLAAFLIWSNAGAITGWIWAQPTGLLAALWQVLYLGVLVLGLVAAYVFALLAGGVVASPFNDKLSERTEQLLTGRVEEPKGGSAVAAVLRSVASTAFISLAYGALLGPVLLLNLLPGVGSFLATGLGGLLSAFFLALEYTDVCFERHGLRLRQKLGLLRRHPALAGGFGLGTSLLLWIPLLNFLVMPVAVIAGTALALHLRRDGA